MTSAQPTGSAQPTDGERPARATPDVVIIGGGPAALSAALMLGRARRRVLVLDAGSPRNRFAAHMHGVLGHEGISPTELAARGREEVARVGVEVEHGPQAAVRQVREAPEGLRVEVADGRRLAARALVVATGAVDELPDVTGLAERWGTGVVHCPYCHGWEVRGRRLGVLLTSAQGLHQAELVRQWSDRVTVFTAGAGDLDAAVAARLRSRGLALVTAPVVEVTGPDGTVTAVRTADGQEIAVDAVFTAPRTRPQDGFLSGLGLARADGPAGEVLEVDAMGRTSHERIWAAGNVVQPWANVPIAIGTGSLVGAAVNAALVAEEFDGSAATGAQDGVVPAGSDSDGTGGRDEVDPATHWEERYAGVERAWSGRPNAAVVEVAGRLTPGRALDLGCGEGGDAVWLAQQGWAVTGLDISPTAVRRATAAAGAAGLEPERCRFVVTDLERWTAEETFDLVTASFLHSTVALARAQVLRRAAERVATGGHLLVVSHAAAPPWADEHRHADHASGGSDGHTFRGPREEIEALGLDGRVWTTVTAEVRTRPATGPDGQEAQLEDTLVLLRRDRGDVP